MALRSCARLGLSLRSSLTTLLQRLFRRGKLRFFCSGELGRGFPSPITGRASDSLTRIDALSKISLLAGVPIPVHLFALSQVPPPVSIYLLKLAWRTASTSSQETSFAYSMKV